MQRLGPLFLALMLFQIGCDSSTSSKVTPPLKTVPNAPSAQADDDTTGAAGSVAAPPLTNPPVSTPTQPASAPLVLDTRTPVTLTKTPPPISGGTLIVSRDATFAIAADPDRDRVSVIDLAKSKVVGHIALKAGDEPGRLVEDAAGRIHVALRGAGAVATIDVGKLKVADRRDVCGAPRGIAYDADADVLQVACTGGELVTLPASGGSATRTLHIEPDLRDVIVQGGHLTVSSFKSATLLDLDAKGAVSARHRPADGHALVSVGLDSLTTGPRLRPFQPTLARRTIAMSNGNMLMLHQRELADTIEVPDPHNPNAMDPSGKMIPVGFPGGGGGNAYGGGDTCNSIVQTGVSVMDSDGNILESANVAGSVLPVDVAVSNSGVIAIASAGTRDLNAPSANGFGGFPVMGVAGPTPLPVPPGAMFAGSAGGTGGIVLNGFVGLTPDQAAAAGTVGIVSMMTTGDKTFHEDGEVDGDCSANELTVPGQPTSVTFTPDGAMLVQSREPALLAVVSSTGVVSIDLGGESRLDTGHELFHRDAGAGIACASCHGEAGDDGHVWRFSDSGERRTQSVDVGLEGTQPFHWSGDMKDLPMLVDRVFVGRMGGASQSPARVDALAHWLFKQQPPARIRAANDPAALRGEKLFKSTEVGCTSCHAGSKLTNNMTVDVGTGGAFQVPSLVGVGYRAPFLHTGCAPTLRDRFDPACGGAKHGKTDQLSSKEIGDLTAYLETL